MEVAVAVIVSVVSLITVEVIAFLGYKVFKMNKELKELSQNTETLANCTLELSKHISGVDVIEDCTNEFNFPNTEGF